MVTGSISSMTLTSAIVLKETRGRDRDCVVLCSVVLLHLPPFGWFILDFLKHVYAWKLISALSFRIYSLLKAVTVAVLDSYCGCIVLVQFY